MPALGVSIENSRPSFYLSRYTFRGCASIFRDACTPVRGRRQLLNATKRCGPGERQDRDQPHRASAGLRGRARGRERVKTKGEGLATLTPFVLAIAVAVRSSEQWNQVQYFLLLKHSLQISTSRSSRRLFCLIPRRTFGGRARWVGE